MKVDGLPTRSHFQWQPVNVETRWWWKVNMGSGFQGQLGILGSSDLKIHNSFGLMLRNASPEDGPL